MAMVSHAPMLRALAAQAGQPPLNAAAVAVGVRAVYRVTCFYADGRAGGTIATLIKAAADGARLHMAYTRALVGKPIQHPIPEARYQAFARALTAVGFDRLIDQSDLPMFASADLWLIERAAGTFTHSVIVAPTLADAATDAAHAPFCQLIAAVRTHLPEALHTVA